MDKNVFFIKADSMLIAVGKNSMKAFDLLFKMHYVFNLEYASELINFYDFIESCIVQLHPPRACCDALNTSLMNLKNVPSFEP